MDIIKVKIAMIQELFQRIHDYNRSDISYRVDIEHCFVECYQLKDHLKNNSEVVKILSQYSNNPKQYIEDFINTNLCLQICGAIANKAKHSENKNTTRADAKTKYVNVSYRFNFGPEGLILNEGEGAIVESVHDIKATPEAYYVKTSNPAERIKYNYSTELQEYIIEDDMGNSYKATELLNDCINVWLDFLKNHKLI